ncbi:MAG: hypothetical protein MOGMAGMI_00295 [Candidatus Omnitrophica bacterium]|jgi:hypothetical protein|nr:hypothetical protein [Candidatus Omnitrophota bacterium]
MLDIKKENIHFFNQNLENFLSDSKLKHKFVVIHNREVKGCFDLFSTALEYALFNFSVEEFIVQQVISEGEQITFIYSAI